MKAVTVLAFAEPPQHWGFRQSRAGTSWFIRLEPTRIPKCLAALKDHGIHARALWQRDTSTDNPKPSAGAISARDKPLRPRGRQARKNHDNREGQRRARKFLRNAAKEAEAVQQAQAISDAKQARLQAEAAQRRAELKKQAAQRLAREQHNRALAIAQTYA